MRRERITPRFGTGLALAVGLLAFPVVPALRAESPTRLEATERRGAGEAPAGREVVIRLENVVLSAGPTRVALLGVVGPRGDRSAAQVLANLGSRPLALVIRGLRAEVAPGVPYHLFLNLPEAAGGAEPGTLGSVGSRSAETPSPPADDFRLIGTLDFHAARPAAESSGAPPGPPLTFDLGPAIRSLRDRGLLGPTLILTLVPAGPPTPGSKPSIASLELVAG